MNHDLMYDSCIWYELDSSIGYNNKVVDLLVMSEHDMFIS